MNLIPASGEQLRLGVVGFSVGNGHPYSWSAIFNGFNAEKMAETEFPVIGDYLAKQEWPRDAIQDARVSMVFCEDSGRAHHIAQASRIEKVAQSLDELLESVDAVLLARDDVIQRRQDLQKIIMSGKPVFVDKPFALSVAEAEQWFQLQVHPAQIFTTSGLRYAEELKLSRSELDALGSIKRITARTPKYWSTYSVHLLEPIVAQFPEAQWQVGEILHTPQKTRVIFHWNDIELDVSASLHSTHPIQFRFEGDISLTKTFYNAFDCFKAGLVCALNQWREEAVNIPRQQTLEVCRMISAGENK